MQLFPPKRRKTDYDLVKQTKKENYDYLNAIASPGQILFIGDSITEIYPTGELYASFQQRTGQMIYNRGISGDTSDRLLERFASNALPLRPRIIVLLIGVNDIAVGMTEQETASNVAALLEQARRHLPECRVIVVAIYPVNRTMSRAARFMVGRRTNAQVRRWNAVLEAVAEQYHVDFFNINSRLSDAAGNLRADLCYDGLHLNARGFAVVTEALLSVLT